MSFYEEWHESDPDTHDGECERCGERKSVKGVFDPFVAEGISDGPSEAQLWCGACFDERASDV